jgi:hypothetical protein
MRHNTPNTFKHVRLIPAPPNGANGAKDFCDESVTSSRGIVR